MKPKLLTIAAILSPLSLLPFLSLSSPALANCIPGDDLQRQVNYRAGLGLHRLPGFQSPKLALVQHGEVVRVNGPTTVDDNGVLWQPVNFPTSGFVAVGSNGEIRNLVACPQLQQNTVRTAAFYNVTDRRRYESVNPDLFVASFGQSVTSPTTLSWRSFETGGFTEGQAVEQLSVELLTRNTAVATVSQLGLADNAIAARRYQIEYVQRKGRWVIDWIGIQWKCWPGRGHQDWSTELCES